MRVVELLDERHSDAETLDAFEDTLRAIIRVPEADIPAGQQVRIQMDVSIELATQFAAALQLARSLGWRPQ